MKKDIISFLYIWSCAFHTCVNFKNSKKGLWTVSPDMYKIQCEPMKNILKNRTFLSWLKLAAFLHVAFLHGEAEFTIPIKSFILQTTDFEEM